ncbi:MAG: ADP-ribosyl-[dinitrogen reductase] hydrolase [Magnetospiraceae bacterium]
MTIVSDPKTDLENRAIGAYLGLAVGDALGATVEFMTPREIADQYRVHRNIIGGGWLRLQPGQITDDTEMSLYLGQSILDNGAVDGRAIAEAFSAWMRSKPVDMGNTVRRGIVRYRQTDETRVPENEYDGGNGACMRVLPVALATLGAAPEQVRLAVEMQSHITHNNALSDAGTYCIVDMVQAAVAGNASLADLREMAEGFAAKSPEFSFVGKREKNPSGFIVDTLRAVFQALRDKDGFSEILIDVVNRGGDADTTGAIAGMLAGALWGVEGIPKNWVAALDPKIGIQCIEQARLLLARAPVGVTI